MYIVLAMPDLHGECWRTSQSQDDNGISFDLLGAYDHCRAGVARMIFVSNISQFRKINMKS